MTQQEVAGAIGVSREWYAMLESAETARPSAGLMERLAEVLMITPEERAKLFDLALPEFGQVPLRDDSIALLEAFSSLKAFSKRILSSTSVEDVFTTATDEIATWFDGALLVYTFCRRECGVWDSQGVGGKQGWNNVSNVIRDVVELLPTSESIDAGYLYPQLANAGDVGTNELHPLLIQREMLKIYAQRRLPGYSFVKARVRSRNGLIGGFCIAREFGYSYSASDRAVLGAFAEFTSIALS